MGSRNMWPYASAMLACAISVAKADTIQIVTSFGGDTGYDSPEPYLALTPAPFNTSLGTLTGVTLAYSGVIMPTIGLAQPAYGYFPNAVMNYLGGFTDTIGTFSFSEPVASSGAYAFGYSLSVNPVSFDFLLSVDPTDLQDFTTAYSAQYGIPYVDLAAASDTEPCPDPATCSHLIPEYDIDFLFGTQTETFTYTPVPEPASYAIFGAAALALFAMRSRRPRLQ